MCHDSHFIYIINRQGIIVDFVPISLPKRGNVQWNAQDVGKLKKAFQGKPISRTFSFTPATDAVSGATITSSIIYDGMNRGKEIFKNLAGISPADSARTIETIKPQ